MTDPAEVGKLAAATAAAGLIRSGMKLGLGTGSTAAHFIRALGRRAAAEHLDIVGVATSETTATLAREVGLSLAELDEVAPLDLTVDGADEIGPDLALIKGGGGALLREKIVAQASRQMLVIADAGKQVDCLGAFPLPIELVPFAPETTIRAVTSALEAAGTGCEITLRHDGSGKRFVSDGGNLIADCRCGQIADPSSLATALAGLAGVVEHGLFIGMADGAIIGRADGSVDNMGMAACAGGETV